MNDETTKPRRDEGDAIPKWARELGEETWEKLNELLHVGWDVPDILRELNVPASKLRSLQCHARKFGPRRRLILFERFKQNLLKAAVELSPDFGKALALISEHAVNPNVKESTQLRAAQLLIEFTGKVSQMMAGDEKADIEAAKAQSQGGAKVDANEVVRTILDVYGLHREPGDGTS